MEQEVTRPDYRCTCSNAPNCKWGSHGLLVDVTAPPISPERLALYAEYERLESRTDRESIERRQLVWRQLVAVG